MQKALNELEEEKLIFTERTNGKYVTENIRLIEYYRRKYAEKLTKEYKEKMKEIKIWKGEDDEKSNRLQKYLQKFW